MSLLNSYRQRNPKVNKSTKNVNLFCAAKTKSIANKLPEMALFVNFSKAIQTRRLTMGVADGRVEADGETIYQVKDMKVALSES